MTEAKARIDPLVSSPTEVRYPIPIIKHSEEKLVAALQDAQEKAQTLFHFVDRARRLRDSTKNR
jgi:hypothetical protein